MSMFDARANPINTVQTALGRRTVTSRNPAVAQPVLPLPLNGTFQVAGAGAGSTWIVVAVDRAIDSVHFTVTP